MTTPHAELLREARRLLLLAGLLKREAIKRVDLIARIDAALAAPTVEGWKWVPVVPSDEMIEAAQAVSGDMTHKVIVPTGRLIIAMYKALLSSAPQQASGWIAVSERLPDEGQSILTWDGKRVDADNYARPDWIGKETGFINITYWQPSPAAPANASGKLREGE